MGVRVGRPMRVVTELRVFTRTAVAPRGEMGEKAPIGHDDNLPEIGDGMSPFPLDDR